MTRRTWQNDSVPFQSLGRKSHEASAWPFSDHAHGECHKDTQSFGEAHTVKASANGHWKARLSADSTILETKLPAADTPSPLAWLKILTGTWARTTLLSCFQIINFQKLYEIINASCFKLLDSGITCYISPHSVLYPHYSTKVLSTIATNALLTPVHWRTLSPQFQLASSSIRHSLSLLPSWDALFILLPDTFLDFFFHFIVHSLMDSNSGFSSFCGSLNFELPLLSPSLSP